MNDYKELVAELKELAEEEKEFASNSGDIYFAEKLALAADAIEQLVKERDAAVADLSMHGRYCITCAHSTTHITTDGTYVWPCNDKRSKCATDDNKYWVWRGVQETSER